MRVFVLTIAFCLFLAVFPEIILGIKTFGPRQKVYVRKIDERADIITGFFPYEQSYFKRFDVDENNRKASQLFSHMHKGSKMDKAGINGLSRIKKHLRHSHNNNNWKPPSDIAVNVKESMYE